MKYEKKNNPFAKYFIFLFFLTSFFLCSQILFSAEQGFYKKSKNFQNIYKKKDHLFFEELFFEQISENFFKKKDFVFANSYGEVFFYNFFSDESQKLFNLKDLIFLNKGKNYKNIKKYKLNKIEIIRLNEKNFIICLEDLMLFFEKNSNNNHFSLKWKISSFYPINLNSVLGYQQN